MIVPLFAFTVIKAMDTYINRQPHMRWVLLATLELGVVLTFLALSSATAVK